MTAVSSVEVERGHEGLLLVLLGFSSTLVLCSSLLLDSLRDGRAGENETKAKKKKTGESMVDWQEALINVNQNHGLLVEVINVFLEDLPRLLSIVDKAISDRDAELLRNNAHSLKGSMLFLGSTPASRSAAAMQRVHLRRAERSRS